PIATPDPTSDLYTLSLHDALPILPRPYGERDALPAAGRGSERRHQPDRKLRHAAGGLGERLLLLAPGGALFRRGPYRPRSGAGLDRKSTRLNSSHVKISYAVFCV